MLTNDSTSGMTIRQRSSTNRNGLGVLDMDEKIEKPVTLQKPTFLSLKLTRYREQNTLLLMKYIQDHINMKNV